MDPSTKRRRLSKSPSPDPYALSDDDSSVYVPVKQRRQALLSKLATKSGIAASSAALERQREEDEQLAREAEERTGKKQSGTAQTLLMEAQEVKRLKALEGELRARR